MFCVLYSTHILNTGHNMLIDKYEDERGPKVRSIRNNIRTMKSNHTTLIKMAFLLRRHFFRDTILCSYCFVLLFLYFLGSNPRASQRKMIILRMGHLGNTDKNSNKHVKNINIVRVKHYATSILFVILGGTWV